MRELLGARTLMSPVGGAEFNYTTLTKEERRRRQKLRAAAAEWPRKEKKSKKVKKKNIKRSTTGRLLPVGSIQ